MKTFPEIKLVAVPQSTEASALTQFKWASQEIGKRHRLGGTPELLQPAGWPTCHSCKKLEMTFYGQLDSIGDQLSLADCGMIYVFVCLSCFECKAFVVSA